MTARPRGALPLPAAAAALALLGALVAGGCSGTLFEDEPRRAANDTPYRSGGGSEDTLELPPDLVGSEIREAYPIPGSPVSATDEGAAGARGTGVLPEVEGLRVERGADGIRRLVVTAPLPDLWGGVREFWLSQGFLLEVDAPEAGVMETGWAEKRETLPVGRVRRQLERFKRSAYRFAVRDRFRTRLERAPDSGAAEVYVTHRGAEEVVRGSSYAWAPRPSDPGLEAEMMNRLMLFLGRGEVVSEPPTSTADADAAEREEEPSAARARLVEEAGGGAHLALDEGFDRAWRRTRIALDRAGFTVEDIDRAQGTFFVRYADPDRPEPRKKGWLRRLFSGDEDGGQDDTGFRIALERDGAGATRIVVRDAEGGALAGGTPDRILEVLRQRLG